MFEIRCKTIIIYDRNPLAPAQRPQLAMYGEFIFTPSDGLAKGLQPRSGGAGFRCPIFRTLPFMVTDSGEEGRGYDDMTVL